MVEEKSSSSGNAGSGMMSVIISMIKYVLLPVLLAVLLWYIMENDSDRLLCRVDFSRGEEVRCRPVCPRGEFSLPGMTECHKWLTCKDIESADFKVFEALGGGAVKTVYRASWKGHPVIYNKLANPDYKPDYKHGLRMLINYQPSPLVTQLVGYCKDKHVTEYHQFTSANILEQILSSPLYEQYNTIATRYSLCIDYIRAIEFLHTHPKQGVRVMCDSNDVEKTLQQFLLTDDLRMVLNDLDALPQVNKTKGTKIKCGHRELFGDFVAPEQLWPDLDTEFVDAKMPPYDEKTDIWKIPDVCEHLFGRVIGSDPIRFKLFKIDQACKNLKPEKRPNATEVLEEYMRAQEEFDLL